MRFARILCCMFLLVLSWHLAAKEIPYSDARNIAEMFLASSVQTRSADCSLELVWSGKSIQAKASSEAPALYVFNNVSGPGFVVVSGDDSVLPVLGYSFEHNFVAEAMPVNVRGWLYGMEDEILHARKSGMGPYPMTRSSVDAGVVLKQYSTALWDQTAPYNALCPVINGQNAYTGCVATAVAIVMKHRKWPDAGTGTVPAYVSQTYKVSVPERKLGHSYDWDNMPESFSEAASETQKKAVARLMADCGAMLKADYGPIGSIGTSAYSSDIPAALCGYMKYDPGMAEYHRGSYTDAEWNVMLRKELDENGPVLYRGQSDEGGHMFVLEAYTNKNYYGVNWGWSGYCNGYFVLTALQPEDYGSGGSASGFTEFQSAVLGVRKNEGGKAKERIEFMTLTKDGKTYSGLSASVTEFKTGVPFDVSFGLATNQSTIDYSGRMGLALADKDNAIKEILHQVDVVGLPAGYGYCFDWNVSVTQPVKVGDQLIGIYYDNPSSSWVKIRGNREYGIADNILLTDGKTIEETASFRYDSVQRKIILTVAEGVSASVLDSNGADLSSVVSVSGNEIVIDGSGLPAGRYKVHLRNDADEKILHFVLGEKQ